MSKLVYWRGYTRKPCENCGRVRVERWQMADGSGTLHICEKCHWCVETSEYLLNIEDENDTYVDEWEEN